MLGLRSWSLLLQLAGHQPRPPLTANACEDLAGETGSVVVVVVVAAGSNHNIAFAVADHGAGVAAG